MGTSPEIGHESGRTLGVRVPNDLPVGQHNMVARNTGGMSVTPNDPSGMAYVRRPTTVNDKDGLPGKSPDPLWAISERSLADYGLSFRPDPTNPTEHGFVEPAFDMSLADYRRAIQQTQGIWVEVTTT